MYLSKKKIILGLVFGICVSLGKIQVVKADTILKNSNGTKIRSANIKVNKSIKVKNDSSRASRGGDYSDKCSNGNKVVNYAKSFLGRPYVWGAEGPYSFDCSGFTLYAYRSLGIKLPHYTGYQANLGRAVKRNELVLGDLIFFNTSGHLSHVGMYVGNGDFIHASSGSHRVIISNLSQSYYNSRYARARRILN